MRADSLSLTKSNIIKELQNYCRIGLWIVRPNLVHKQCSWVVFLPLEILFSHNTSCLPLQHMKCQWFGYHQILQRKSQIKTLYYRQLKNSAPVVKILIDIFSHRSLPLQQQRRGRVEDIEFNLTQHPLALFPHLEESLPPDVSSFTFTPELWRFSGLIFLFTEVSWSVLCIHVPNWSAS